MILVKITPTDPHPTPLRILTLYFGTALGGGISRIFIFTLLVCTGTILLPEGSCRLLSERYLWLSGQHLMPVIKLLRVNRFVSGAVFCCRSHLLDKLNCVNELNKYVGPDLYM